MPGTGQKYKGQGSYDLLGSFPLHELWSRFTLAPHAPNSSDRFDASAY